jgi:hypothetical protein
MKEEIERSVVLVVPLVRTVAGQESMRSSISDYAHASQPASR